MKIKFIKPFRFIGNAPDDGSDSEVPVGHIVDLENDESTQWLIDNGFAEKVEEGAEWLHDGASYYQPAVNVLTKKFVPSYNEYWGDAPDEARRHIGICYKSRAACQRFIDFLTAIEVVSHDEGFMPNVPKRSSVWVISYNDAEVIAPMATARGYAGSFRFYSYSQARDSLDKHPNEWQTILDYDWSKGEEEEDED